MWDDDDRPPTTRVDDFGNTNEQGRFANRDEYDAYGRDLQERMRQMEAERQPYAPSSFDEGRTYYEPANYGDAPRGYRSASSSSGCSSLLIMIALAGGVVWMCSGDEHEEAAATIAKRNPARVPAKTARKTNELKVGAPRGARSSPSKAPSTRVNGKLAGRDGIANARGNASSSPPFPKASTPDAPPGVSGAPSPEKTNVFAPTQEPVAPARPPNAAAVQRRTLADMPSVPPSPLLEKK